jgi:hypothetical protein
MPDKGTPNRRRYLSRLVLRHGPRQVPSWLILDVGEMKPPLKRRMRVAWPSLIFALPFSALATLALTSGELYILPGRSGSGNIIVKATDPSGFKLFLGAYLAMAVMGWLFAFFEFRRGSWFNPI